MDKKNNNKSKASKKGQTGNNQQKGQESTAELLSLRAALRAEKEVSKNLASDNAALRKRICNLERGTSQLTQEKQGLEEQHRASLSKAQDLIQSLEAALKLSEEQWLKKVEDKDLEINQLLKDLQTQKEEAKITRDYLIQEQDQMVLAFQTEVQNCKSLCQTITEQNQVMASFREKNQALSEKVSTLSSQLELKQQELDLSFVNSTALRLGFKEELASREEGWRSKEEALLQKVSSAEQDLQGLAAQNLHLQELLLQKQKKKKRRFWRKESSREEKEAPVLPAQHGLEEEEKGKKEEKKERKGFWSWARKK